MRGQTENQVVKRRVFYIPGYDPIHPRRYRELYRKEGKAQSEISGYQIGIQAKPKGRYFGWTVDAVIDGKASGAQIDVLVWSDIVRESMEASIPGTYLRLVQTAWVYLSTGALARLMQLRKGPVIAALYPIGMLILQLAMAVIAAGLVFWAASTALSPVLGIASQFIATGIGILAAVVILRWFRKHDSKFFAYYLLHDYAYAASSLGRNPEPLEARMEEFVEVLAEAVQSDTDEVLVVGHSSGAHLAISVLADLIRQGRVPSGGPALSFLSLGQVVPMVSFLPGADRLRGDLRFLSARDELTWVDVTAPGDGCAFALCDPVSVSGVAPENKKWPLVFSAAFTQSLSPARWKALRWRFFRLHFQYLCAFDQPKDYDYFQITAGAMTLGDRYANRSPSKSLIDHAVSKYTTVAA